MREVEIAMFLGSGPSAACSDIFVQQTRFDSCEVCKLAPRKSLNCDQTHVHEVSKILRLKPEFKASFPDSEAHWVPVRIQPGREGKAENKFPISNESNITGSLVRHRCFFQATVLSSPDWP